MSKYAPIPYCYILIDKNKNIKFFCDLKKNTSSLKKNFKNIEFIDIELTKKFFQILKIKNFN